MGQMGKSSKHCHGRLPVRVFIVSVILLAAALFVMPLHLCGAYASEKDSPAFIDDSIYTDITDITVPFLDTINVIFTWDFPYSDEFFMTSPEKFSPAFARGSLGFASSTFRSVKEKPEYETYLTGAGFYDLYAFGYDKPTGRDTLSGVIGQKRIGDFTVIAAAACGQGYEKEWVGNLQVGGGERHEGFDYAAGIMKKQLQDYIHKYNIKGKKKLWLAGYSRAAAVANLTAADMIGTGEFDDVYAYLFGVPRTTKKPAPLPGIYNIIGQYDPVPQVALQSWGFERFGTDLYTPAQESDSGYTPLALKASEVSKSLQNDGFRNNPELNYQEHLVLEFLGELFPTNKDYEERFQDILMKTWQTPDLTNIHTILTTALGQMKDLNTAEENAAQVFVDYLSFAAGEHIRADQRQVDDGSWNPDEPLAANLVVEHRIATYLKWLFSDSPPREVYRSVDTEGTLRITFLGNIGLEVRQGNTLLRSIDQKGNVTTPEADADSALLPPRPFLMRNGRELVANIPEDGDYRLVITADKRVQLSYYGVLYRSGKLKGYPDVIRMGTLPPGSYTMDIHPGRPLPSPEAEKATLKGFVALPLEYSASIAMDTELDAISGAFISVNELGKILLGTMLFILTLLLVCLVIYLTHRRSRRDCHPPYSDLYVIVPHVLLIAIFSFLTQFLSFFMFSVTQARAVCAGLAILCLLLLQIRALIRRRNVRNLLLTVFFTLFIPALVIFYSRLMATSYSTIHALIYYLMMAVYTVIAVRSFYRGSKKQTGS